MPEPESLSHLSALKDAELLYERGVYPVSTYIFKHALTREVLYESILSARRKELDETIGSAMEELYGDRLEEHSGVLCRHFITGENYAKGAEYAKLAACEAERWTQRAMEADRENDMRWELARDHEVYGDWFKQMGDLSGARDYLGRAIEAFQEYGAGGWVKRAEEKLAAL